MVINGVPKFACNHEFVAFPFGFVCHKCEHQRPELELDGDKRLLFFPIRPVSIEITPEICGPSPRKSVQKPRP